MARGVKTSIEDKIAKQEATIDSLKRKLSVEEQHLKELKAEQEKENQAKILSAIESSGKSVEDIMNYLNS